MIEITYEQEAGDFVKMPEWIEEDMDGAQISGTQQGGCASGSYMPAVTYYNARKVMSEHGDDVLEYIEEQYGELPAPPADSSWSGICVFYLSCAVELWCGQFEVVEAEEA